MHQERVIDMIGGIGPLNDELLGINFDNGSFKDVETKSFNEGEGDRERMMEYGKLHRKKGFFARLFARKKTEDKGPSRP